MKKLLIIFILILLPLVFFYSCYDDNEETMYRFTTANCDLSNVTFSLTVNPVIQSNCTSCHSGSAPSGNLSLQNYNQIVAAVNSKGLYSRISNSSNPMPPGGLMDECKIKQIKKWIDSGLPNN